MIWSVKNGTTTVVNVMILVAEPLVRLAVVHHPDLVSALAVTTTPALLRLYST